MLEKIVKMAELIAETRNDGRELTTTVSLLTLLFLPGTFISVSIHVEIRNQEPTTNFLTNLL